MMTDDLRSQIAAEAARLMLRGKEADFAAARKRAARWLKPRKLRREDMPSHQEIQVQLYALSGLMASERDPMLRAQLRHWVHQVLVALTPHPAVWIDELSDTRLASGAEVLIEVRGDREAVRQQLTAAGFDPRPIREPITAGAVSSTTASTTAAARPRTDVARVDTDIWEFRLKGQFPCVVRGTTGAVPLPGSPQVCSLDQLQQELTAAPVPAYEPADDEHPDSFAVFQMLLEPLARVQWPSTAHPEGDALYHSLQVFELGKQERPYDEEFLLACLLHDVGYGINPRHPVLSGLDALGSLITERTRYLIEQRPVGSQYLLTGECPRALRKHPDFDDVTLLARCDRDGRVPGAVVPTLEEAFAYLENLEAEWEPE